MLDGLGGYCCYGLLENCDENVDAPGFPICLAENVRLVRDKKKDEKIYSNDVEYDQNDFIFDLHRKAIEISRQYC